MIQKISIKNFKCLKNIELNCANLNLFTGRDGTGKSSVLQVLLLLKQSYLKAFPNYKEGLVLKGDLINIGTGKDAFCIEAGKDENEIGLGITFTDSANSSEYNFGFKYEPDSEFLSITENSYLLTDVDELSTFCNRLKYLHSDRWVKNQYKRSDFDVIRNRNIGKHGEYTAHFLSHFGSNEEVHSAMMYPATTIKTLDYQVSAWIGEISHGIKVKATRIRDLDIIKLGYQFTTDSGDVNEYSATNVGFGITYSLPVVVLLLSAKPGDILIIENPELHVHPQGQSAIAKLMVLAIKKGVQIFVETHSDHIINGILVATNEETKRTGYGIKIEHVKIHFFSRVKGKGTSQISLVEISPDGRINNPPKGFFDQFSKDMKTIMGF